MRVLFFTMFFLVNFSIAAQELTIQDLLEIAYCKDVDNCFTKAVHRFDYKRQDYHLDEGYTANNGAGTKKVYAPKDGVESPINELKIIGYNWKIFMIIFTDDYDYWYNNFYNQIATSENFIRKPNLEGESDYEDWVFIPSGYPSCKIMFTKTPGHPKGNYNVTIIVPSIK